MSTESFYFRHTGSEGREVDQMLESVKFKTLDDLIDATVPSSIRLKKELELPERLCEFLNISLILKQKHYLTTLP